ncbi:MAG: hypothetical protein AABM66_13145 [Actinomycetota bacterium]
MRPQAHDIAVPPFPPGTEWVGPEPGAVERICARGPLLVHFVDAAHVSSVRTLPYVGAWEERYRDLGLTLVGVNSPRFPFTADAGKLAAALTRLEVGFPVAADSGYRIWHDYGCEGWPSLFLWGRGGALRWFHFGEGEYAATEAAIQEELRALDPDLELPEPLSALRPSDAAGALVAPPSHEVFPGGSESEPWRSPEGGPTLELDYAAAGAWATIDGRGSLRVSLDGGRELAIEVEAPGAYELAAHERHEAHHMSLGAAPGVSVYSIAFAAGVP